MEVVDGRSTQIFDFENQDGEGTGTFGKRKIFCDYGCWNGGYAKSEKLQYKEYFGKTPKEFMKKVWYLSEENFHRKAVTY